MKTSFKLVEHFYDKLDDILCDVEFIKKGKKNCFSNVASVFDIEASSFYNGDEVKTKAACMYAWVFGINGKCIRGRTWEEFENVINRVAEYYATNLSRRFIIYVHNLSYEFQWIKKRFEWAAVFSVDNRKPVYAIMKNGIELRCSYILSNYSLAKVGENLVKYKVKKMVGDLDYNKIRHSETPLTDKEWGYVLNDGLVVMAYIQEEIENNGSIVEIPYTKTGYVRRYCRNNCLSSAYKMKYSALMKKLTMSVEEYKQAKRAFAGGYCHANKNKVNKVIRGVCSIDFSSAYPAVMVSEKFPMSKAKEVKITSKEDFIDKLNNYCCLFEAIFYEIKSVNEFANYISRSKCSDAEKYILDNGKIVYADKIQITLTEQDFYIISKVYKWSKMTVGSFRIFYKDYLPKPIVESVLELYKNKTTLKGVEGKEVEYLVSKGMLNGIYGMSVTDPCRDEIIYSAEADWYTVPSDIEDLLNRYNKSFSRFLYYYWGVWITAYNRRNLYSGILEFKEDYCYSDTDSIKGQNYEKHKEYVDNYNKKIVDKITRCLKYHNIPLSYMKPKTIKGVEKQLGIWDYEGEYDMFKTLGAKRYIIVKDNKLMITISGVQKNAGEQYLLRKYKTFNNIFKHFTDGLCFPAEYKYRDENKKLKKASGTGKLCHTYIDEYMCDYVTDYLGNKGIFCEYSSVHLEPAGYDLSLDDNFIRYLLDDRSIFCK